MGAWGVGVFECDGALDLLGDIVDNGPKVVVRTIDAVMPSGLLGRFKKVEIIEAFDGEAVLAVGEVIAFLGGRPITDPPELLASAADRCRGKLPAGIAARAIAAIARVRDGSNSELRDLWIDSGELDAWIHVVDDLLNRLG